MPRSRQYDPVIISSNRECAEAREKVETFVLQLHHDGHYGDPIPLGTATSSYCLLCYQYHFIISDDDGWMEDLDQDGEPFNGETAALALLAHYQNRAANAVAALG